MRIAYVITRVDDIGGAQVHVRDLAKALMRRGHEVIVISGRTEGPLAHQLADAGVEYRPLPHLVWRLHAANDVRALLELREALRDFAPDIVSAHSSKAGILARLAARSLGIPVIFTAHGWSFGPTRSAAERLFHRTAERLAAPFADRIITVCEADRRLAVRESVFPSHQAVTIHNGMPDVAPELQADPVRSPPRLVMVARFAAPKDHRSVLHAVRKLKDLDWTLDFVGTGPDEPAMRELAEGLELGRRVRFLGYRDDIPGILASAQTFILSSTSEGFPRSILEAMRAGLPIIAPDVGGISESVFPGRNGFLVPPGDVESLRDRFADLILHPDLRASLGRASRELYAAEFTFERMLGETLVVYEEVLGMQPGRLQADAVDS